MMQMQAMTMAMIMTMTMNDVPDDREYPGDNGDNKES